MAFRRRAGARFQGTIWPGFVDAITALLMVMIFVLTIFMVVQFVLNDTISSQDDELNELNGQLNALAETLGLARTENAALEDRVATLSTDLSVAQRLNDSQTALIAQIGQQLDEQAARIASFESQVAGLLAANSELTAERDTTRAELDETVSEAEALSLALAAARDEIDAAAEAARRDAAEREVLDALIAELETEAAEAELSLAQTLAALQSEEVRSVGLSEDVAALEGELSDSEAARLADLAAAEELRGRLADAEGALSAEEEARLADALIAEQLRDRLENANAELTAMSLALEEQRRQAEETLTLLAAAREARADLARDLAAALAARAETDDAEAALEAALDAAEARIAELSNAGADVDGQIDALELALAEALAAQSTAEADLARELSEAERQAALLAQARDELSEAEDLSADGQRQVEALNQQVAALRAQLGELQGLLDLAAEADVAADVQIENLGSQLNSALARATIAERARAELEAAEAARQAAIAERLAQENEGLVQNAEELAAARSEFFAALRALLEGRQGVQIVGDRFVFSSEVLFATGAAELEPEGQDQIATVARQLLEISEQIPEGVDWVLRVDGHTDNIGASQNNWELSQARALSVVLFLIEEFDFPPDRLAANGFGEFQPVAEGNSPEALAANRRIELKLTER